MLRAQVQSLVRELRFPQAAWKKKKNEFLLTVKKKRQGRGGGVWPSKGAVFLGARNGLLLDPYNGFPGYSLLYVLFFFFLLIFSVTVSHSFNKRASQKQSLRNSRLARRTGVKKKKQSAQLL